MIRYRLSYPDYPTPPPSLPANWIERLPERPSVIVSLDANDPNEYAPIVYEGHPVMADAVKYEISHSRGMWGHLIGAKETTPIDLDAAIMCKSSRLKRFNPELLDGQEILDRFVSDMPELEKKGRVR